jgi:ubiquinone/menaquinone biosynthesis C-methylase UbiE
VNELHLQFLASPQWAAMLTNELLPWLRSVGDLGDDVLEIGPGPGLTTDLLKDLAPRVTAVELDEQLARSLSSRLKGTNVTVINGDATQTGLDADRFSAATCFSMLHHVPQPEVQDRVFAEVHRVLRPGGQFAVVDSLDIEAIRGGHVDDIFVPVDPETLGARLEAVGFSTPIIEISSYEFRAHAVKR